MEMDDEIKSQKQKREKKIKKQKKDRETKFDWSKVWNAIKVGFIVFLKVIWKIIKFILKYILFPFWYTGVLFVKGYKFLRHRSSDSLTDEDKDFLSQIPALFLMLGLSIFLFYLLFYFDVFERAKDLTDPGFWQAVGNMFVDFGLGISWVLEQIFVVFLWNMIIVPFANLLSPHQWVSTVVLVAVIIIGGGLIILTYNLIKKGKFVIIIKNFFAKIKNGISKTSQTIKSFVLKYNYGEKYVETRTKNFFWINFLFQIVVTIALAIFSVYMVIQQSIVLESWDENAILRFAAILGVIVFAGIGIFSTWFFTFVNGVSSSPSAEQSED